MAFGRNAAKEAMTFTIGTGRKVKGIRNSRRPTIPKLKGPKAVDNDRLAFRVLKQTLESSIRVESHDGAAAEIANQQLIRVFAESAGSKGNSPRRAKILKLPSSIRTAGETMKGSPLWIESIN